MEEQIVPGSEDVVVDTSIEKGMDAIVEELPQIEDVTVGPTVEEPGEEKLEEEDRNTLRRTSRARKQVERIEVAPTSPKEEWKVPVGKGCKLADIENVAFQVGKLQRKDELLKVVHNLLFRRPASFKVIKSNILEFSGFAYPEENASAEREKDVNKLEHRTNVQLDEIMQLLDIPKGSGEEATKSSKIKRIIEFLDHPKPSGRPSLAGQLMKKKAKKAASKKRSRKTATSTTKKIAKAKTEGVNEKRTNLGKQDDRGDDSTDSEEPLMPKKPSGPSDALIEQTISEILESKDLSAFSLKDLYGELGTRLDFDARSRKSFVKETAMKLIQKT